MTGTYFKRREMAVYATLLEGLPECGQRYVAIENYAKVAPLHSRRGCRVGRFSEGSYLRENAAISQFKDIRREFGVS